MATPVSLLPKIGTPEWEQEVKFYRSGNREAREIRGSQLGYTNPEAYNKAIRRRGVKLSVPESHRQRYTKAPVITEPSLVIFDSQIPFHDAPFLNNLLELAHYWGIEQGISGGDLMNMTSFSLFFEDPEDKIWKKEAERVIACLEAMQSWIPKWELVLGNHEAFLLKKLAEQIGHKEILKLLDKPKGFTATNYYYCHVQFGGTKWRISHPRNISVIHGRIPQRLCEKFHSNVASGHGHLAGLTPDYSGKYMACDVGITCDSKRLDYVSIRDTTRPEQCSGALILMLGDDGKCHPYHLYPDSDWEALKGLYKKKKKV